MSTAQYRSLDVVVKQQQACEEKTSANGSSIYRLHGNTKNMNGNLLRSTSYLSTKSTTIKRKHLAFLLLISALLFYLVWFSLAATTTQSRVDLVYTGKSSRIMPDKYATNEANGLFKKATNSMQMQGMPSQAPDLLPLQNSVNNLQYKTTVFNMHTNQKDNYNNNDYKTNKITNTEYASIIKTTRTTTSTRNIITTHTFTSSNNNIINATNTDTANATANTNANANKMLFLTGKDNDVIMFIGKYRFLHPLESRE